MTNARTPFMSLADEYEQVEELRKIMNRFDAVVAMAEIDGSGIPPDITAKREVATDNWYRALLAFRARVRAVTGLTERQLRMAA